MTTIESAPKQAVMITGASTGIGEATALLLAREGFVVFAGVRQNADGERLTAQNPSIRPVIVDVTLPDTIAAAAQLVAESGVPLRGLVNNAGIALAGPLEFLPVEHLRRQFDVNVFGHVAVSQAFLPALRKTKGRIVFVGSIAGLLATPFVGPYSASKFALEAVADVFRLELAPAGIAVSLLEPGAVKTPIWAKGRAGGDTLAKRLGPQAMERYGDAMTRLIELTAVQERDGMPAEVCARAILHALTARRPRARYLLGGPARMQRLISYLPERARDAIVRKVMGLS